MTQGQERHYQGRDLLPLWLLILVFCLPMVLGWLLYLNPGFLSGSQQVNGHLIVPPRSLSQVVLPRPAGSRLSFSHLQGQWLLMLAVRGECGPVCRRDLFQLQKIEKAVGRDQGRVQRLLVLGKPSTGNRQEIRDNRLLDTTTAFEPETGKPFLSPVFSLIGSQVDSATFVVDPMGRLMLAYHADTPPIEILSDIKQLLTATKNWNRGCAVCPAIN
jgi:hypothetical protein